MKKIIIYLMLIVTICFSTPQKTYAWGIVFDPTMFAKQIGQYIQEVSIAANSYLGGINQLIDTTNNLAKPVYDAMTVASELAKAKNITTAVGAAFGGNALLVGNPSQYLLTKGGIPVKNVLEAGILKGDVLNSVVEKTKYDNSSLTTRVANINQPDIAMQEQARDCNDTRLSAMAKSQVALSGGDYNTVKGNLNSSLCVGNPRTDPALAQRLITRNNQDPSLASFRAITSGKNPYTIGQLTQIEIDKAAAEAKAMAAAELAANGGIKNKTTCTKKASDGTCLAETIDQSGSVIKTAYAGAVNPDISKYALGSTISKLFGTFNGLGSLFGVSSGGGSTGNVSASSNPSNTTTSSSTGYAQNLANDKISKEITAGAPKELLTQHLKALDDLKKADNDYVSTINSYNSQLDSMKACYDNVLIKYPNDISAGDPRIVAAQNFYTQHKNTNATLMSQVAAELNKIAAANTLITNTISIIDNSNSTDEITAAYKNYQKQVTDQSFPEITTATANIGKQMQYAGELQISIIDGGDIFNLNATCASIQPKIVNQN